VAPEHARSVVRKLSPLFERHEAIYCAVRQKTYFQLIKKLREMAVIALKFQLYIKLRFKATIAPPSRFNTPLPLEPLELSRYNNVLFLMFEKPCSALSVQPPPT